MQDTPTRPPPPPHAHTHARARARACAQEEMTNSFLRVSPKA